MKKILLSLVALSTVTASSAFADSVGQCGWGSKLFEGDKGVAPQILAVTTNGASGSQTFGISSQTSGCVRDGTVSSNWKTALFMDSNKSRLALDMSAGQGESLDSLAAVIGVQEADKARFFEVVKANASTILSSSSVTAGEATVALRQVVAADAVLAKYAQAV